MLHTNIDHGAHSRISWSLNIRTVNHVRETSVDQSSHVIIKYEVSSIAEETSDL